MKSLECRRLIGKLLEEWLLLMGLSDWQVVVEFGKLDSDGNEPNTATHGEVLHISHNYKRAEIQFDPTAMARDLTRAEIEESVVHELTHLQLASLTDLRRTQRRIENTTTDISRTYMRLKRVFK